MRSIERSFKYHQMKNPCLSTWTCFTKAIMGRNFSEDRIRRHFNLLVEKDDYEKEDKRQLLSYLYLINRDKS